MSGEAPSLVSGARGGCSENRRQHQPALPSSAAGIDADAGCVCGVLQVLSNGRAGVCSLQPAGAPRPPPVLLPCAVAPLPRTVAVCCAPGVRRHPQKEVVRLFKLLKHRASRGGYRVDPTKTKRAATVSWFRLISEELTGPFPGSAGHSPHKSNGGTLPRTESGSSLRYLRSGSALWRLPPLAGGRCRNRRRASSPVMVGCRRAAFAPRPLPQPLVAEMAQRRPDALQDPGKGATCLILVLHFFVLSALSSLALFGATDCASESRTAGGNLARPGTATPPTSP